MNYKKYIAIKVSSYLNLSIEKIENSIVTPSDIKNGDYSLLCFKLNEKLNKSPSEVSSYLKLKLNDTKSTSLFISKNWTISSIAVG